MPPAPTRCLLAVDVDDDLAFEDVERLVGFGMPMQRGGLALRHHVFEQEEGAVRVRRRELPGVQPAAEERPPVAFACCPDDRNWSRSWCRLPSSRPVWDSGPMVNYGTMMGMSIPYEMEGRIGQKRRTRDALIAAARELVANGETPTVEAAAEAASISRTTAYRYFPNRRALLVAAHPETGPSSLLPEDAPDDAATRLDLVIDAFTPLTARERGATAHDAATLARSRSRAACAAATPAGSRASNGSRKRSRRSATRCPTTESTASTLAIRSATGIEAFVWLTDVAGLSRHDARRAHALVGSRVTASEDSVARLFPELLGDIVEHLVEGVGELLLDGRRRVRFGRLGQPEPVTQLADVRRVSRSLLDEREVGSGHCSGSTTH